jgi:hypothetical protein
METVMSGNAPLHTDYRHGAVAARSLGIPALLFRTDSRVDLAAGLGATVVDNESSTIKAVDAVLDAAADACPPSGEAAVRALKEAAVGTLCAWQDRVEGATRRGRTWSGAGWWSRTLD